MREADLLIHVVDISHPQFEEQLDIVKQTLQEIGAGDKPVYLVFNKVDAYTYVAKDGRPDAPDTRKPHARRVTTHMVRQCRHAVHLLSARERTNIDKFRSDPTAWCAKSTPDATRSTIFCINRKHAPRISTAPANKQPQYHPPMTIHTLNHENTVLNKFIAQIRDKRIQQDLMRFRRNMERIGEITCYEISKL